MEIETSPLLILTSVGATGDTLDAQGYRGYYSIRDRFWENAMTVECRPHNSRQQAGMIHFRLKAETHIRIRTAEEDIIFRDWVDALIEAGLNAVQVNRKQGRIPQ